MSAEYVPSGGVNAWSPVNRTEFATTAFDRLRILRDNRTIAMVGLSANPFRPSHFAAIYMLAEGYNVIPVNPREREILGRRCYPSLRDIPEQVGIVFAVRRVLARIAGLQAHQGERRVVSAPRPAQEETPAEVEDHGGRMRKSAPSGSSWPPSTTTVVPVM